jgi:hypothetical protein
LQILGIKPFGEPAIDFRQQLVSFGALALVLPQARETRGGAEFEGLGLLFLCNLHRFQETGFSFLLDARRETLDARLECEFAFETIEFSFGKIGDVAILFIF